MVPELVSFIGCLDCCSHILEVLQTHLPVAISVIYEPDRVEFSLLHRFFDQNFSLLIPLIRLLKPHVHLVNTTITGLAIKVKESQGFVFG